MGFSYLSAESFRGPRKSLIFGERPQGTPKSSARMGRAESEVGSTAAELQFFSIFLMNAIAYFDLSKSFSAIHSDDRNLGTPAGLLEPSGTIWNALRATGTREAQLEQASAPGTPSGLLEQPIGLLERALAPLLITATI